jgi:hypothetical protein
LPRPSYSPDLAPYDFFFFPCMKEKLRWCQFQSAEIITATREAVPSCKYLSSVFPARIPMLADLHSGQWWLSWGRMWIRVCEYLVWYDKNNSPRNYWL